MTPLYHVSARLSSVSFCDFCKYLQNKRKVTIDNCVIVWYNGVIGKQAGDKKGAQMFFTATLYKTIIQAAGNQADSLNEWLENWQAENPLPAQYGSVFVQPVDNAKTQSNVVGFEIEGVVLHLDFDQVQDLVFNWNTYA